MDKKNSLNAYFVDNECTGCEHIVSETPQITEALFFERISFHP